MNLKIASQIEQPLLKRKHIVAELQHAGAKTPSNKETLAAIAGATGAAEDTIAIRSIQEPFGSTTATVDAYVYQSKEILAQTESRPKPKAAAGAPAPEAK